MTPLVVAGYQIVISSVCPCHLEAELFLHSWDNQTDSLIYFSYVHLTSSSHPGEPRAPGQGVGGAGPGTLHTTRVVGPQQGEEADGSGSHSACKEKDLKPCRRCGDAVAW